MTILIVTPYSSQGPSASQNAGRGCVNPFFCITMLGQELSLDSIQITESQGGQSQLRVEVTGMYLSPNSLIPRRVFNLFISPPNVQCSPYQETVFWHKEAVLCHRSQSHDNEEDDKRSDRWTDGAVEPDTWCLVGLSFFLFVFSVNILQFYTTVFISYTSSECEAMGTPQYPYRNAYDTDTRGVPKWSVFV